MRVCERGERRRAAEGHHDRDLCPPSQLLARTTDGRWALVRARRDDDLGTLWILKECLLVARSLVLRAQHQDTTQEPAASGDRRRTSMAGLEPALGHDDACAPMAGVLNEGERFSELASTEGRQIVALDIERRPVAPEMALERRHAL